MPTKDRVLNNLELLDQHKLTPGQIQKLGDLITENRESAETFSPEDTKWWEYINQVFNELLIADTESFLRNQ